MIDYEKFNVKDITKLSTGKTVYCNKYWECIGGPEQAIFYGYSPQCNSNEQIMRHITSESRSEKLEKIFGEKSKIIFVPVAYFFDERPYD